jgi:phosphoribosylformylglycinamidine synthase
VRRLHVGKDAPTIKDAVFQKKAFNTMQELILDNQILAGHDIGRGDHNFIKCVFC